MCQSFSNTGVFKRLQVSIVTFEVLLTKNVLIFYVILHVNTSTFFSRMPTVIYRMNQRVQGSTFRIIDEDLVPEVTEELREVEYKGEIKDQAFNSWKFSGDRIFVVAKICSSVSSTAKAALRISLMHIKRCVTCSIPFEQPGNLNVNIAVDDQDPVHRVPHGRFGQQRNDDQLVRAAV